MIPFLEPHQAFPNPRYALAHENGLVCVTAVLTPDLLLAAYPKGIFPWFDDEEYVYWFSVAPRAVLLPENLHLSRSLKQSMRKKVYQIKINQQFAQVMAACAEQKRPEQNGSWISPRFQAAYTLLHQMGQAHSFEYYNENNELAGGLYGVQIGSVFFGESMFARECDASKIAFAHAVPYLAKCGVKLIDCQQDTAHLRRFGSQLMPFDDFQAALNVWTKQPLLHAISDGILQDNQNVEFV